MKRLVVVGAGISGLSAAHAAMEQADGVPGGLEVIVLEAAPAVGGKARSVRKGRWLVEEGPTGYLDNEPEFDALLQRAGIADHKVEANGASARRYLLHGRLRELKANPLKFASSGILGPAGLARVAAEPFVGRASEDLAGRESIWDFAARRLGSQAADKLIAPMVLGVFAGDARELSLSACFPKLATLEREHGGLIRGMMATRKNRSRDEQFATGPSGKLVSSPEGLQTLPRLLAKVGNFETRCNARVDVIDVERDPRNGAPPSYRVAVAGDAEPIHADAQAYPRSFLSEPHVEERFQPIFGDTAAGIAGRSRFAKLAGTAEHRARRFRHPARKTNRRWRGPRDRRHLPPRTGRVWCCSRLGGSAASARRGTQTGPLCVAPLRASENRPG